ncbi:MAG: PAS domain S-box protein [Campylobacterales bacterium]|nr:PAS domain S-box protein [Campylobacterales bacterium]
MSKIITFLAKLGFWMFVTLFTTLTLIMSEFLVVLHSYWLTGDFFDKNLLIAGFIIPIIDGFIVFGLVAFLIRYLNQLQDRQEEVLRFHEEAEEKLRKSENYQRAILDSFPFFLWLKDTNGDYLATNIAVAKATGFDNPSEIIGKNDFDLFPEEMANSFRADDKEVMQSLQKKELEELIEGNGERRWHETYKAPILDKEGNLFGTVGFARDITKDKESEEELRLMKHALDHVKEAVYLTNCNGEFVYVNDGATRQLGYTKEEIKTMGIPDIDPNFPKSDLPAHWKKLKGSDSLTFASTHKDKNGNIFPVEINSNYIEYRGSAFSLAFVRDITTRKQIEDKLKLSASVFTSTHEGIIITDTDNNIIDVNGAFTTITGYSYSDVLGKNPRIFQSGRNDEEFYAQLWMSLENDGVWKGELWNRKKNGEEYVENTTISIVYNDKKAVQNYISIFTDITQQKRQHQELEHHAHYDVLTNLPNRMLFADRMKQAIVQTTRNNKLIAVAYIDIDGFKAVNDTYGHTIGDKLLILLAKKMTMLLRESDTVSRVGGDEFIALFVDIQNEETITPFLNRLIETLAEPIRIDTFPINVSASIGVTFYPQKNKLEIDQIIRQADQAMYRAKMSGKNQHVIFNTIQDGNV